MPDFDKPKRTSGLNSNLFRAFIKAWRVFDWINLERNKR